MAIEFAVETYVSPEDALAYAEEYGLDLPSNELPEDAEEGDLTELEKLLKRASKSIDRRFGKKFIGYRPVGQVLQWPRDISQSYDSYDNERDWDENDGIPLELSEATIEMAALIYGGKDLYNQDEAAVTQKSESIGDISTTYTYKNTFKEDTFYRVWMILEPLLKTADDYSITQTRGA